MTTQEASNVPAIEDWSRLLAGKVAVVTGGGDGIGGAISRLFAAHGAVLRVNVPIDRDSGRPRGFGFVEMGDDDARTAIAALDGTDFGGRDLRVNEARPRADGGGGGGGGGYDRR